MALRREGERKVRRIYLIQSTIHTFVHLKSAVKVSDIVITFGKNKLNF